MNCFYAYIPEMVLRIIYGMTKEEVGDYFIRTTLSLLDERKGETELADFMIDDRDAMLASKRSAGSKGGQAKARNRRMAVAMALAGNRKNGVAPLDSATQTDSIATEGTQQNVAPLENRLAESSTATFSASRPLAESSRGLAKPSPKPKPKPEPVSPVKPPLAPTPNHPPASRTENTAMSKAEEENRKPSAVDTSGKHPRFSWSDLANDKYGYIRGIDNVLLPEFALWYCGEQDNARARAAYAKFVRVYGAGAFRAVLERFVADTESGEEPDVRGAAFMAALKRSAEVAREGGKDGH